MRQNRCALTLNCASCAARPNERPCWATVEEEMDCREIIIKWLHDNGHDGLCEPDTECGCGLDDFAPCGDGPYPKCKAAKARTLLEHEYVGDCGPGEIAYFVSPNA